MSLRATRSQEVNGMRFVATPQHGDSMAVNIGDKAIEWLASEQPSPVVARLDPYRDSAFSGQDLRELLEDVDRARRKKADEARERLIASTRLPKDPAIKDQLLNDLVERATAADDVANGLRELHAFLEIAAEASAIVHVDGD
jgi:hypothetical protein